MKFYFEIENKKKKETNQKRERIGKHKERLKQRNHFFLLKKLKVFAIIILLVFVYIASSKIAGAKNLFQSFFRLPTVFATLFSFFSPTPSSFSHAPQIIQSFFRTLSIAISSTTLASFFALIFALLSSDLEEGSSPLAFILRAFSIVFRDLPLPAWVILFLFSFGQNEFTGWFVLFIVSLGALSRIFRELIETTSKESFATLRSLGASRICAIVHGVLPNIEAKFVSWLLYSLATNIRDSALVGILTGSGLGFLFMLFFRSFRYDAAGLVIISLTVTVLAFDFFARKINAMMKKNESSAKGLRFRKVFVKSLFFFLLIFSIFSLFITSGDNLKFQVMLEKLFQNIVAMFFNFKNLSNIPFGSLIFSCLVSLALAFLTTFLSCVVALPLSVLNQKYFFSSSVPSIIIDSISSFIRSIPTIIWVLLFSVCLGVGPTSTIIGLSIHSIAYLVYAFSMSFNSIDKNVLDSLSSLGASKTLLFFKGVLPSAIKSIVSWSFFRFEINFVNAVALGSAAGAGGIGYELFIAGSMEFDIQTVGIISYLLLLISSLLESASNSIKKRLQNGNLQ